jgi:hypothetical protein
MFAGGNAVVKWQLETYPLGEVAFGCQGRREDASAGRSENTSRGIQSGPCPTPRSNLIDEPAFLP